MNFKNQLTQNFSYLTTKQMDQILLFYKELLKFKHFVLTKINPEKEAQRLIVDSIISGHIFLNKMTSQTIVDVGSGAGFPGMIFALMAPSHFKFILIEPSLRKSEFLKHCVDYLQLHDKMKIIPRPLNVLKEKVVIFKAFAPLKNTLILVEKYLPADGISYHFKSADYRKQWEELSEKEKSVWSLKEWASYFFEGQERFILEIHRKY